MLLGRSCSQTSFAEQCSHKEGLGVRPVWAQTCSLVISQLEIIVLEFANGI